MIRGTLSVIEIAILSVLILATRCANYQDVFVAGNIYFTDADCYARMTRVRMCSEHPGLIVTVPRLRELPDRNHSAHNCAAGLSHSRLVDLAETIHAARDRDSRRADLAVACAARRLVFLVVVTANEISLSLGDADSVRN